jgi:hypothetical protein
VETHAGVAAYGPTSSSSVCKPARNAVSRCREEEESLARKSWATLTDTVDRCPDASSAWRTVLPRRKHTHRSALWLEVPPGRLSSRGSTNSSMTPVGVAHLRKGERQRERVEGGE